VYVDLNISVADPHHFDADADPDPDPNFPFNADPDPDPANHLDSNYDPYPTLHFDEEPDSDKAQKSAQIGSYSIQFGLSSDADSDPDPAYHFYADPTFQFDEDPCGPDGSTALVNIILLAFLHPDLSKNTSRTLLLKPAKVCTHSRK
jgi:hypothetical protein